jgi:hypothetical protein
MSFADSLLDVLEARRGLGVFDPRDMLFAHLGMVGSSVDETPDETALLEIDYGKTHVQVYEDLAKYLFERIGFRLFSYLEVPLEVDVRMQGLASWIPNWMLKSLPNPYSRLCNVFTTFRIPSPVSRADKWLKGTYEVPDGEHNLTVMMLRHAWVRQSIIACVGFRIRDIGVVERLPPVITLSKATCNTPGL